MDVPNIIRQLAISALPVLIAITFHEVSHGFIANKLGDPTAKLMGRLTLNPLAHIDIFGTVILPLMMIVLTNGQFVFGYAKPVPINPLNFKDPKKDMAISAAAGPITNLCLAIASLLLLKFFVIPSSVFFPGGIAKTVFTPLTLMLIESIRWNVVLAAFNLIPIPPLDGGRVLVGFLPHKQAISFSKIEPFGFIIVLILIYTGIAGLFIIPLVKLFMALLQLF